MWADELGKGLKCKMLVIRGCSTTECAQRQADEPAQPPHYAQLSPPFHFME